MSRRIQIVGQLLTIAVFAALVLLFTPSEPLSSGDATAQQIERGRYLVTLGGCGDCHTPKKMTEMGIAEDSTVLLSGHPASEKITKAPAGFGDGWIAAGNSHFTAWAGPWGVSFAANLTSDEKTGLGNWTAEQFIKAMRTGKHRGFGRPIMPPMPWMNLSHATDSDLTAMLAFFKSTKAIANEVPVPLPPAN